MIFYYFFMPQMMQNIDYIEYQNSIKLIIILVMG